MTCADIGCGMSAFTLYLHFTGTVTGVDPNPYKPMGGPHESEEGATPFAGAGIKIVPSMGALADNSFDRVFCISVIEHLPRRKVAPLVKEMVRILKPGGLLIATVDVNIHYDMARPLDLIWQSGLHPHYGKLDLQWPAKRFGKADDPDFSADVYGLVLEKPVAPISEFYSGGVIYQAPGVRIINKQARGYLDRTEDLFDIVMLPAIDSFGASGAGLYAAQESYLYTLESFTAMFNHLTDQGVLCVTRWLRIPPRDGLRIFDTAVAVLRNAGLDPRRHLVMIRGLSTVSVIASKSPLTGVQIHAVRSFCSQQGFDLCYLPDMTPSQANRYQILERPYYFQAAEALLGPQRQEYLTDYLFKIAFSTDDKPYFHDFLKWRSVPVLMDQLGGLSPAYVEIGYLMILAALLQAILAAAVMIVLPLCVGIKRAEFVRGSTAVFGYFLLLGAGFMLLEMGFLQKLILYLAHPIYSAAAVIGSFLFFGGLGSQISQYWSSKPKRTASIAAVVIVSLGVLYLLILDDWLELTRAQAMPLRLLIAAATISPLAFAMGHMFPTGLRQIGITAPALVPWAWAVNGFASVTATVAAPLLAMNIGFLRLTILALGCYALAAILSRLLPDQVAIRANYIHDKS